MLPKIRSNNGSQHLSALTRDEITAPHVNLVPLDLPGDLYKYVGDHVWEQLAATVSTYPKHQVDACNLYIDTITELKKKIAATEPASDARQLAVDDLRKYKETYIELGNVVAPVFWLRIKDQKHKRKVVKRNVMTLPYGGTSYGLG